jgi:hypothetical protein
MNNSKREIIDPLVAIPMYGQYFFIAYLLPNGERELVPAIVICLCDNKDFYKWVRLFFSDGSMKGLGAKQRNKIILGWCEMFPNTRKYKHYYVEELI